MIDVKGGVFVRSGTPEEAITHDFLLDGVDAVWSVASSHHKESLSFVVVANDNQVMAFDLDVSSGQRIMPVRSVSVCGSLASRVRNSVSRIFA
jgi:hypothetical protein